MFSNITIDSWEEVFLEAKNDLNHISKMMEKKPFYPLKEEVFRAFELVKLQDVKVVIFGQDPYPTEIYLDKPLPKANGLAFSLREMDPDIPKSLRNIFKQLNKEGYKTGCNGSLEKWAKQGVLLLNTALTVKPKEPGSYLRLWLGFITVVIKFLHEKNPKCIYVVWGIEAMRNLSSILGENKIIFTGPHPRREDFIGYFKEINKALVSQKKEEIDWSLM